MKRALVLLVVLFSIFTVATAQHAHAAPFIQCGATHWKTVTSTPFIAIDVGLTVSVSEEKLVDNSSGVWCGDIRGKGTFNRSGCSSYLIYAELLDARNDTLGYNSTYWNSGCGGQYALFGNSVDGFNYPCPFYAVAGDNTGNWDTPASCS